MPDERMRTSARSKSVTLWTAASLAAKLRLVDLQLPSSPLKSGLSLDDASLDGLDAITAGQRFPRAGSKSLEDDIGVEEERG